MNPYDQNTGMFNDNMYEFDESSGLRPYSQRAPVRRAPPTQYTGGSYVPTPAVGMDANGQNPNAAKAVDFGMKALGMAIPAFGVVQGIAKAAQDPSGLNLATVGLGIAKQLGLNMGPLGGVAGLLLKQIMSDTAAPDKPYQFNNGNDAYGADGTTGAYQSNNGTPMYGPATPAGSDTTPAYQSNGGTPMYGGDSGGDGTPAYQSNNGTPMYGPATSNPDSVGDSVFGWSATGYGDGDDSADSSGSSEG